MQRFTYKAKDGKTGKIVKGAIQAESERAAGKLLIEQGFTPEVIEEERTGGLWERFRNKVTTKDRIVFTRQFATLIGAGLPLSNSLRTVADQTQSAPMKKIIEEILAEVEAGKALSDSFAKYPKIFNNVYLSLIRAGETSGTLDLSLKRLAAQEEKDEQMMSDIRGALTYPGIVLLVILAVMVFMIVVVVPQVQGLYTDLGKDLPWATAMMVAIANFLIGYWWVLLIVIGFFVWFFVQFVRTDTGTRAMALLKLNVPLFNGMFRRLYMSRFARTMQNLLSTGVAMLDALKISAEAMNNVVVEEQIKAAAEKVKAGRALSESLKERDYMLPLVPQMASIGEQSGKIDEMLGKAAQVYENELDEQIRTISKLIEPVLMVIMALLVGGMVGAILFPIYSLVSDIQMG